MSLWLVTLREIYTRDAQFLPNDITEDNSDDWIDFGDGKVEIVLGVEHADNRREAKRKCKEKTGVCPDKMYAYKLAQE